MGTWLWSTWYCTGATPAGYGQGPGAQGLCLGLVAALKSV